VSTRPGRTGYASGVHALVRFRLPDGRVEPLVPGDVIGRPWSAALRFDDPHVSEAHAMVSLRGDELVLLALRRHLYVDGRATDAVTLRPGLVVNLCPSVALHVESAELPATVLGVEGDDLVARALPGTCGYVVAPMPRIVPGLAPDALAVFWFDGFGWRVRVGRDEPVGLAAGDELRVGGRLLRAVEIPLRSAGHADTAVDPLGAPLRIVAWFDTVHVHREGAAPAVLSGQMARVLSELVVIGAPVPWYDVAGPLWPAIEDRDMLRRRWDVLLVRLRDRLREAGLRPDLVRSARTGLVELVLREGDVVVDRT
jgi:hypothetical protein